MTQVLRAEAATNGNVEIDGEGAAKVTQSKKRLLGPMLALATAVQPQHHAEQSGRARQRKLRRACRGRILRLRPTRRSGLARLTRSRKCAGLLRAGVVGLWDAYLSRGGGQVREERACGDRFRSTETGRSGQALRQRAKASIMYTLWGYLIQKRTQR